MYIQKERERIKEAIKKYRLDVNQVFECRFKARRQKHDVRSWIYSTEKIHHPTGIDAHVAT